MGQDAKIVARNKFKACHCPQKRLEVLVHHRLHLFSLGGQARSFADAVHQIVDDLDALRPCKGDGLARCAYAKKHQQKGGKKKDESDADFFKPFFHSVPLSSLLYYGCFGKSYGSLAPV